MTAARRILVGISVLAMCCGWAASSATAAFPGRNGLLVAEPVTGGGLALLTPSGTLVSRICGDGTLCGVPAHPRFSPNGLAIVFANATARRVGVVAPDGTCLWCMVGAALTTVRGGAPTFTADGQSITLAGASGGMWRASLTSGSSSRMLVGAVSDAAWSSTGELAIVRRGTIWLRARGRSASLHRLGAGTAPSFSPDGSRLAVARAGWVLIMRAGRGARAAQRLVRGGAPAWSPDGREIAYIAPGGDLRIIVLRTHRSRALGIRGRSVDWQPLTTAGSRSCTPPAGWHAIAHNADSIIAIAPPAADESSFGGWYGCLKPVNKWRLVLEGTANDAGYETRIDRSTIAGRFVLLASSYDDKYFNCSHSLTLSDVATGAVTPLASSGCSYGYGPPGFAFRSEILSAPGFAAWVTDGSLPTHEALTAIACPSASLCVAGDEAGRVASSANPFGGRSAWKLSNIAGTSAVGSLSCPATSFCAATVRSYGSVFVSTDVTGGPSAWRKVTVDRNTGVFVIAAISCPTASLCVLADGTGNIVTSRDPTGGTSSWHSVQVLNATPPGFLGLTCPSASLCVALDERGDVVTSTNPTGGATDWKVAPVDSSVGLQGPAAISCPSASLCAAVNGTGHLLTSTNPTGGTAAWTVSSVAPSPADLQAVSCPSTAMCVATDNSGNVYASADPTGGAGAWHRAGVDAGNSLAGVSCATVTACVAVDNEGNVLTSSAPLGGAAAWSIAPVDVPDCAARGTQCGIEQLFVHDGRGSRAIDATPPGSGGVIGNPAVSDNGLLLTWTHDGFPRQFPLR